jgi:hypothetical protein
MTDKESKQKFVDVTVQFKKYRWLPFVKKNRMFRVLSLGGDIPDVPGAIRMVKRIMPWDPKRMKVINTSIGKERGDCPCPLHFIRDDIMEYEAMHGNTGGMNG